MTDPNVDAGEQPESKEQRVAAWVRACFGEEAMLPHERALRLLEEAIELAQAEGVMREVAERCINYIYERPAGHPIQEAGGVACTLLAWAAARETTFDAIAEHEIKRIEEKSAEYFRRRQQTKADAGLSMEIEYRAGDAGEQGDG